MNLRVIMLCLSLLNASTTVFVSQAAGQNSLSQIEDDDDNEKRRRARKLITQYFPDLDENSVDGWVDAYSLMSEQELTQLLQQRKLIGGGGAEFPKMKLDLPIFDLEGDSIPANSQIDSHERTSLGEAHSIVRRNLAGMQVAGHRSQLFLFIHSGAPNSDLGPFGIQKSWDLALGRKQHTGRALDITIVDAGRTMFRLEPGCILTRNGHFIELDDGRLGQIVGGRELALYPEVRVPNPKNASPPETDHPQQRTDTLEFGGVVVQDASLLRSSNGIYFSVRNKDRSAAFRPMARLKIKAGTLELSNVDLASQQQQLQRLQFVEQFYLTD